MLESFFDRFVPANVTSPEQAQPWRYMAVVAFFAAPAHLVFAVQYMLLGATVGAIALFTAAVIIASLPVVGLVTRSAPLVFATGMFVIMSTLSILTLSKGHFALSTLIWFGVIPVAALLTLGDRWMWISLVTAIVFGVLCYVLPLLGVRIEGFQQGGEAAQTRVSFISWSMFMCVAALLARVFARTLDRTVEERRQIEALMQNSKRMQAIGELAGGVAHEFNNLLTVIQGTADFLKDDASLGKEVQQGLADIQRASIHGGAIAKDLLDFSRGKRVDVKSSSDAIEALQACVRLLQPILGNHIQLETRIAEELPTAGLCSRTIEQIVVNLALNANDAMKSGGTLCIRLEEVFLRQLEAEKLNIFAGSWLKLTVSDTGEGMTKETMARIYEPFFTTKASGTGLGLAVVFGLITNAGGSLSIQSEVGRGTEFSVYLPLATSGQENFSTSIAASAPHEGTASILLVEDQEAVRRMARRILERAGYFVEEAEDGSVALEVITAGARFDLILSDVRMPRLDGTQLATELRRRNCSTPILFMTGFAGSPQEEEPLREHGAHVLRKPFSATALLQASSMILAGLPVDLDAA